ncbi:MAG: response regulator transcription factor [Actinomycetota bacterium]|nr:response regulator transcription factor [Actinomycetota bacterium]
MLAFVARGFEAEGFTVDAAADGLDALRLARESSYAAVVLDLLLPQVGGLTLLRELRQQQPELPVVILSARSDLATKLRGFEFGANDYVAKPFALAELIARVRAQLRHANGGSDGNVVRVGKLDLDLARRQARVGERVTDLSDREFRVLHHLALHPGEVISRERLLNEVWGYHFDPRSNVVEVCVRRLRQKLGEGAPIETIRHAGYRLVAA